MQPANKQAKKVAGRTVEKKTELEKPAPSKASETEKKNTGAKTAKKASTTNKKINMEKQEPAIEKATKTSETESIGYKRTERPCQQSLFLDSEGNEYSVGNNEDEPKSKRQKLKHVTNEILLRKPKICNTSPVHELIAYFKDRWTKEKVLCEKNFYNRALQILVNITGKCFTIYYLF